MNQDRDTIDAGRPWWKTILLLGCGFVALLVLGFIGAFVVFGMNTPITTTTSVGGRIVAFTYPGFTLSPIMMEGTTTQMEFTFAGHKATVYAAEVTVDATTKIAIPAANKNVELSWLKNRVTILADGSTLWNKKM